MRNARSVIAWGSAALSLALLGACSSGNTDKQEVVTYHAAYPAFSTSPELIQKADLVIRGVALNSRVEQLFMDVSEGTDPQENPQAGLTPEQAEEARKSSPMVVTVSTVRVDEVIKGDVAVGATVEVSQLGGTFEGVRYEEAETSILSSDTSYVLFLAAHGSSKPYDLLNPKLALYEVSAGGALTPVNDTNPIDIKTLRGLKAAAKSAK